MHTSVLAQQQTGQRTDKNWAYLAESAACCAIWLAFSLSLRQGVSLKLELNWPKLTDAQGCSKIHSTAQHTTSAQPASQRLALWTRVSIRYSLNYFLREKGTNDRQFTATAVVKA